MVKIVGFNISRMSAEREKEIKGRIEIKSNLNITDIKKEDIEISKENEVIAFEFDFSINYEPKIAEIAFKGNVLALVQPNEAKDIFKDWKKKKIGDSLRLLILNTIILKCNIKAFQMEEDLGLPFHVPMPKLSPQQQQQNYAG